MPYSNATKTIPGVAGEAVVIYRFVDPQDDQTWDKTDDPADLVSGIAAQSVASGVEFSIATFNGGIGLIELGASVSAGLMVSAGTAGVGDTASIIVSDLIVGPLLIGGDSGEIVPIIMSVRTVDADTA